MITKIVGVNIKGLSFTQEIGPLTLFIGPNGAGKSARSQALILALLGYIPGAGKQNAEILDNYGDGKEMAVGVEINDHLFQRKYARSGDSVSQAYGVGGKKRSKEQFSQAMFEVGRPVAIDIGAFMDLSDNKKIDAVFDLYPPETDISKIVADIEDTKTKINALMVKAKSTEDAAARLTTARAQIEKPVGTLADISAQIAETEKSLAQARQDLQEAEIEEQRLKAVAEEKERADKAIKEAEDKAAIEARRKLLQEQAEQLKAADEKKPEPTKDTIINGPIRRIGQGAGPFPETKPAIGETKIPEAETVEASIQKILNALNGSGCTACAARLVAIRELRKYQRKAAA
jgi:DNA repair exonuclease SbcCD ATPase subunit